MTRQTTGRATKAEAEARTTAVRRWITEEGVAVEEAVERLRDEHGIGRRQALRYWVRAYRPLLTDEERWKYRWGRPRGERGRYAMWPSVLRAQTKAMARAEAASRRDLG